LKAPDKTQDPWYGRRTLHGFTADELISVLQKSIRRGMAENAALVAYEMFATGEEFEDVVWRRLEIISVEDVGFGRIEAPLIVKALEEFRRSRTRDNPDRLIFLIHTVRLLASCQKDRTSDEMTNWVRAVVDNGEARPEIFDDALDMHTGRGQDMGRDFLHWFTQGARVENEIPNRDLIYRERVLELLTREG
jgi:replication-associated recombination protein RarA